jgi:hypothetical protein
MHNKRVGYLHAASKKKKKDEPNFIFFFRNYCSITYPHPYLHLLLFFDRADIFFEACHFLAPPYLSFKDLLSILISQHINHSARMAQDGIF